MTTLYGIKNCDTVKKARRWLADNGVEHRFHDVRADGLDADMLEQWIAATGWERLLNKRGTTWRKLDAATQEAVNESNVIELLLEHPAMIKRPVLVANDTIEVGFKEARYSELLNI